MRIDSERQGPEELRTVGCILCCANTEIVSASRRLRQLRLREPRTWSGRSIVKSGWRWLLAVFCLCLLPEFDSSPLVGRAITYLVFGGGDVRFQRGAVVRKTRALQQHGNFPTITGQYQLQDCTRGMGRD